MNRPTSFTLMIDEHFVMGWDGSGFTVTGERHHAITFDAFLTAIKAARALSHQLHSGETVLVVDPTLYPLASVQGLVAPF